MDRAGHRLRAPLRGRCSVRYFPTYTLHSLDVRMTTAGRTIVRYADDFVILCQSQEEAEAALAEVAAWIERNMDLRCIRTRRMLATARRAGHGFDFLGYRFDGGHRYVRSQESSGAQG